MTKYTYLNGISPDSNMEDKKLCNGKLARMSSLIVYNA